MSTVNNAKVWAKIPARKSRALQKKLDARRLRPFYETKGTPTSGQETIGFQVPQDMTVQEAILLLATLVPEGTEIHAS